MGWCEAAFKTDLNYFYTKEEQINNGVVDPKAPCPETQTLFCPDGGLSGHGQGLYQACPAPQLPRSQSAAGCEGEDNPACSSILCLEFGTQRICISTTLLIHSLKQTLDEVSRWLRWRKGRAFFQLAAFG